MNKIMEKEEKISQIINEYCTDKNKSIVFIIPLIKDIPKIFLIDCVNCYVKAEFEPHQKGVVYVAFQADKLTTPYTNTTTPGGKAVLNSNRLEVVRASKYYIDEYDIDIFKVFSFKIEEKYIEDVNSFIRGDYTKLSKEAKDLILAYYNNIDKVKDVLYPTASSIKKFAEKFGLEGIEIKNIKELLSKPNIEQETFKLSNFLKLED